MRKSLLWITETWRTIRSLAICRRPRCGKDGIEAATPLVHPSTTSRSFTTHLPRPCRGLYSCHGTGYSAGIPDTEAKGNDVFAGIDVISHVIPVCSYMRESRAYHALPFPDIPRKRSFHKLVLDLEKLHFITSRENNKFYV